MNKKTFTLFVMLMSLVCLSCACANDLNDTDADLSLAQEDSKELEVSSESDDIVDSPSIDEDLSVSGKSLGDEAYLVLDNDADIENIYLGDYVTWMVGVYNAGPDTAKNVKVYDKLPDGLKYVKHSVSHGTFNPKTGIWNIGNLSKGVEAFLNITTKSFSTGEKVNKVYLTTDSINLNNETYEEEEIDVFKPNEEGNLEKPIYYSQNALKSTGNPIVLILLSMVGCLIGYTKRN